MYEDIAQKIILTSSMTLNALIPWTPILMLVTAIELINKNVSFKSVSINLIYLPLALIISGTFIYPIIELMQKSTPFDVLKFKIFILNNDLEIILWFIYLLFFDLLYYFFHRAQHKFKFLWRYHLVHHSDKNISASAVGRHHWMEEGFRYFFITAPLIILMGGTSNISTWASGFIILNGIFMHWNIKFRFGLLEKIIVTPAYHRIHHSVHEKHYDKNFGVFTQFWDFLFKTRYLPMEFEHPETGVIDFPEKNTWALLFPLPIILHKDKMSK